MALTQSKSIDVSAERGVIFDSSKIKSVLEGSVRAIGAAVDRVVEYPGSVKGDHGRWFFVEWLGAKITGSGGTERR